ncbi:MULTISPECIES: CPBP family intramembrane glutamic endopeptidase [unclassified Microbacterium]|uniref:CPBP family intramembrane glutamic endopeptidase n=1 Tax=unclassified Microbacterium TaxID=2609290 RepID=UPI0005CC222D|nr:CPBP family intramembrane metalloprotease [Micrococcus sp. JV4]RYC99116.1 CPBP family intramembrane metalloprotease [Micrococcus sp. MS-ASIII-49]
MRRLRAPLPVFLIVSFGVTWLLWLPLLLNAQTGSALSVMPYQFFLASFGPLLGAVAATLSAGGFLELRVWVRRAFSVRFPPIWWAAAVGMPLAYGVIGYVTAWAVTGTWPDLSRLGLTDKLPGMNAAAVALVWTLTFGLGEEAGWRGWLLPHLARRMSVLTAALVVAGVWICWHLPAFFFNPTYMQMGWSLIGWMIALVAGSLLLSWITARAAWSIIPVLIWHAGFDLLTAADQSAGIIASTISAIVILQGVLAAWLLWRTRGDDPATTPLTVTGPTFRAS